LELVLRGVNIRAAADLTDLYVEGSRVTRREYFALAQSDRNTFFPAHAREIVRAARLDMHRYDTPGDRTQPQFVLTVDAMILLARQRGDAEFIFMVAICNGRRVLGAAAGVRALLRSGAGSSAAEMRMTPLRLLSPAHPTASEALGDFEDRLQVHIMRNGPVWTRERQAMDWLFQPKRKLIRGKQPSPGVPPRGWRRS
jgi:hypothetical protein